jgi:DNA mismatch repair ATPase MutS
MGVHDTPVGPVLTHKVVQGGMSRSFGIMVAQRAGLPAPVIERATAILQRLDQVEAAMLWARAVVDIADSTIPKPTAL